MKSSRQEKILAIIERESIETQNQLMEALAREGVKSTQATLSRDIRDLHLVKELAADGAYRYVAAGKDGALDHDTRLRKIFRRRTSSSSRRCPAWPTRPAPRWTACPSRIWSAPSPATTRPSSP